MLILSGFKTDMKRWQLKHLVVFLALIFDSIFVFSNSIIYSQDLMESRLNLATDAFGPHPFLLNPSSFRADELEIFLFNNRGFHEIEYIETDGSGNEQAGTNTKSSGNNTGIALGINMGSGLNINLIHQMIKSEEATSDRRRSSSEFIETYTSRLSVIAAVVELFENLSLGLQMRFLDAEVDLVGNLNVNPRNITSFRPSLLGSGGGLELKLNNLIISAAYVPPLKGKAEIYSEERIITRPGFAEFSGALDKKKFRLGLSFRRWLYKKDGKSAGTTLDDANQSSVNLYGLNVERNLLFPLTESQIGFDYPLTAESDLRGSISRISTEINPDIGDSLPGENVKNTRFSYHQIQVHFIIRNNNLALFIALAKSLDRSHKNARLSYSGDYQGVTLGVKATL